MAEDTIRLWDWSGIWTALNSVCDVEALAQVTGALRRQRKISGAEDLLRTVLTWALTGKSLTQTLLLRAELGGASLSKQSLQERLVGCGPWLEEIVAALLGAECAAQEGLALTIADATTLSRAGACGTEVRLHVLYDLARCRIADVQVSDVHGGERLDRFALRPGEIRLADAGHASPAALRHARACGGHVLMRVGWNSLSWRERQGRSFDLIGALMAERADSFECELWVGDGADRTAALQPVRILARRRSPEAAARSRRRLRENARRKGRTPDRRSLAACDWQIILTTLPVENWPAERLFPLYALRWQIELAFKRMKSIAGIADLAMRNDAVLRSWLAAHLIAALLQERALDQDWRDSFPSAPRQDRLAVEPRLVAA